VRVFEGNFTFNDPLAKVLLAVKQCDFTDVVLLAHANGLMIFTRWR